MLDNATLNANALHNFRKSLQKSPTYLIYNGLFFNLRNMLEASLANPNETGECWINSSLARKPKNQIIFANQHLPKSKTTAFSLLSNFDNNIVKPAAVAPVEHKITILKRTPLMLCSLIEDDGWSYSIAQNLLEKGADVGIKDANGHNALMYACLYERPKLIELFTNALGDFKLLETDFYGNTALHLACLGRNASICSALHKMYTKYGIDPLTAIPKNHFGHRPYDMRTGYYQSNTESDFIGSLRKHSIMTTCSSSASVLLLKSKVFTNSNAQSTTNFSPTSQRPLSTNIPLLSSKHSTFNNTYKMYFMLKEEPLIKLRTPFKHKQMTRVEEEQRNKKKFMLSAAADGGASIVRSLRPPYLNSLVSTPKTLTVDPNLSIINEPEIDFDKSWRDNFAVFLSKLELHNSESYRPSYSLGQTKNLFEQIAAGSLFPPKTNNNSRRNSIFVRKSGGMSQLVVPDNRKPSIANNMLKNSTKLSRRQSITSSANS